jgi:hypothetical protein
LILWSGLSESNRHLNLGKVPYYHYTKAAQLPSFYNTPTREQQAFSAHTGLANTPRPDRSGNLSYPGGLHYRRAALALCEAGSLIFVGVNATKLFPVGVEHAYEEMMMFAAAILVKRSLASYPRFFRIRFCHVGHLSEELQQWTISQGASSAQVPEKIVTWVLLQQKNSKRTPGTLLKKVKQGELFPDFPGYLLPLRLLIECFKPAE